MSFRVSSNCQASLFGYLFFFRYFIDKSASITLTKVEGICLAVYRQRPPGLSSL
jgi:hypothetical protein